MRKPVDRKDPAYRAVILGTGSFVPEKVLTNDEIAQQVDTSDEWINTRTGIRSRHITSKDESTALLATNAAQRALKSAGIKATDLDMIIVGTITPEMVFPATACFVQNAIGASNAWAHDLAAACSGFVYGISTAQQFIETGRARHALVIGADTLTKLIDWNDRASCILFGDGAGAVVLGRGDDTKRGILYSTMGSDGGGWTALHCQAHGSRHPATRPLPDPNMVYMSINGKEIYQQAVRTIVELVQKSLKQCELDTSQLKLLIPHQMNARIIESAAKRLKLPKEKVFVNIAEYGNTSAASIPIALDECMRTQRLQTGDLIVFVAFGAGLTWGANVIRV